MSQVSYRPLELKQLIQISQYILIVKNLKSEYTEKEIKFSKKFPPFKYSLNYYEIIETLKGKLAPGDKIEVAGANVEVMFKLNKDYYEIGLSSSPVFQMYNSKKDLKTASSFIVFLSDVSDNKFGKLKFTVTGAIESIDKKKEITKLIKKLSPEDGILYPSKQRTVKKS